LDDFKAGKCNILVATDVAARGIDIQGVTHVINFDIPGQYDDYVHRIGRTARAKAKGDAITFVSADNAKELAAIENGMGKPIPEVEWSGSITVPRHFRAQGPKEHDRKPARERSDSGSNRNSNGGANRNGGGNANRNASGGANRHGSAENNRNANHGSNRSDSGNRNSGGSRNGSSSSTSSHSPSSESGDSSSKTRSRPRRNRGGARVA
jgi:superfamily II DNA/RNA helicase